ncbi:MAG: alpha/beta hydrolase [Paracoccaceae bacterium]
MTNLDDEYANGPFIPNAETYPPKWSQKAQDFRDALGAHADLGMSYGPSQRQCFDMFHPNADTQGTLIFVHGGYWRAFDNQSWSHLAKGALGRNWAVAMPTYDLCPDVPIATITQQIAAAVTQIAEKTEGPIALTGHSAGGHLVARMLAEGMVHTRVSDRISRVAPISPLSDLEPLTKTTMNDDFRIDLAMARAESPLLQSAPPIPVTIWVGAAERPAFIDQARWLAAHWDCSIVESPEKHHFDIIDALEDPESEIVEWLTSSQ